MLEITNLTKTFYQGWFRAVKVEAVKSVSFSLAKGKTLGLVGKSGCGKSTLARLVMGLLSADSGKIVFNQKDITQLKGKALNQIRQKIQIVFQHPLSSFNPQYQLQKSLLEPLRIHGLANGNSKSLVIDLIKKVGLHRDIMHRYPHEVSGGELQRVAIARTLTLKPDLLILDEPTSMLDVSMQAKIVNLLKEIQLEYKMAFLFISHDLDLTTFMGDRIAVMHEGKISEPEDTKTPLAAHTPFQEV